MLYGKDALSSDPERQKSDLERHQDLTVLYGMDMLSHIKTIL